MPFTTSSSAFLLLRLFFFFFSAALLLLSPHGVSSSPTHFSATTIPPPNPLAPKAALIRYWARKIPNGRPKPPFLLNKASPLSAADAALFDRLAAAGHLLPDRLRPFCSAANLLCFPDLSPELDKKGRDGSFASYLNSNFSNYATSLSGGLSSFKNYSDGDNVPVDTFRRYGRDSRGHRESFTFYSPDGNFVTANFTSYAGGAAGGAGDFAAYHRSSNAPNLKFTNYDAAASGGRAESFSSYSDDTNAGDQSFSGYGKRSSGVPTSFSSYAANSNVVGSSFSGYGESAANPNDTFTSYASNGNVPKNDFRSYSRGATGAASDSFNSYRDQANVGDDSFSSYGKGTKNATSDFSNYGQSFNEGSTAFKGYGDENGTASFKTYGVNTTFKSYSNPTGTTFTNYKNTSSDAFATKATVSAGVASGRLVNRWIEPGKFFRESSLRTGNVMSMPDIRDKMPPRSFLPRSLADRMPFSSARLAELNRAFNVTADTSMAKAMTDTLADCERAPSRGEAKHCPASVEAMIDFATSVLGGDVVVRSTESTAGWGGKVRIGKVKGIDGGRVTKAVSCHQSLFPYMVYYCHSVPEVRVYEVEITAVDSGKVINHGVAICHLDTSDWSPGHGAFVALGPGPGKIEVCHWIFEGDMTWAAAD